MNLQIPPITNALSKSPKPYFIITAGATGSGKTKLVDETKKYLNIENVDMVTILVDNLVENDDKYKKKILEIINSIKTECNNNDDCEKEKYTNPTDTLYKKFSDAYFTTRKEENCKSVNNTNKLSCDDLNDQNIKNAIKERKNIVFEFTGSYIPTWLLDSKWIADEYIIVITYSLVTLNNLVERNKSRAYKSVKDFYVDNNMTAPRLPNVSYDAFKPILINIYNILKELYNLCIIQYNKDKCGEKKIDQLLIFDNNGTSLINIFDSKQKTFTMDEFTNLIKKSFGLSSKECKDLVFENKYLKYKNKYLTLKNSLKNTI
jgi:hypothetical protein